ncbi:unnamed protein product [Phaedon cochleariae]|uniref:CCHC-type domain-containing protein n=1 Tax=Phaedon cochleariae TaxID=80249 RepID=A0A9N9SI72_PHACE|nr:unnamed protein product [Phaedon cochleariae]
MMQRHSKMGARMDHPCMEDLDSLSVPLEESNSLAAMSRQGEWRLLLKCQNQSHQDSFDEMLRAIERTMIGEFKNLQAVIELQNKKISEQDEVINKILKKTNLGDAGSSKTYANVAAVKNTEVIVIKPREKQDSNVTKSDLKAKIDPKGLAIGVENMRRGEEGAVIINCTNTMAKQKIKQKVESDFGSKYSVADGVQKNPKIIIRGVEEEYIDNDDSAIIECIKEQNDLHIDESTIIEVQRKYKQKDKVDKGNIVLTVDVSLKERICELGRVNIGWRRCMAHEFFSVMRCFKCARYGHTAQKCENNVTCFNCGGSHKSNDCPDPENQQYPQLEHRQQQSALENTPRATLLRMEPTLER